MKFDPPDYFDRFVWFGLIVASLLAVGYRVVTVRSTQPKPTGHYQVDETLNYAAWYFFDTLQDDLRNTFQR